MKPIPIANTAIDDAEADAVFRQIKSGWISMGERVKEFERAVADYIGSKHAIVFNNGTATLHTGLKALGVGPGDEVIVPAMSYISSANTVIYCGAKPVFVEERANTFNVDAEDIEQAITPKTKAIMPVDLKGMPVDYDSIMEIANRHNIPVLADSAEAFGAIYKNDKVGMQAQLHSFSFFANKNITTGEGGVVTTNDDELAEFCRCFRNQGQTERYVHTMIGQNYRMTDMAAAFGLEQLKKIDTILSVKNDIAKYYNEKFAANPDIITPFLPDFVGRHSWYMYCLSFTKRVDRDKVIRYMQEQGVDYRLSFPLIPLQPIYREMFGYKNGDFPRSESIYSQFVDIPCWMGLTKQQLDYVVSVVEEGVRLALKGE